MTTGPGCFRVVVAGAGHAGGTLAAMLRQKGFEGSVTLVGEEEHAPYHRPPLSKQLLTETDAQWLRPPDFYAEQDIRLLLGESIVDADAEAHTVVTSTGRRLDYDVLVIATGARARRLTVPGSELAGVLSLRTLNEAQELRAAIARGGPLAVVGGGYVGLEIAGVVRSAGLPVTVIEREDRILSRVASSTLSRIMTEHHRGQGTDILTGTDVVGFTGTNARLGGVRLADGQTVPASTAVVGVGAIPRDGLAASLGLTRAPTGGIVVDAGAHTSDPCVLAIGDVTVRPTSSGPAMRFESIPSAVEQAKQAAASILEGSPAPAEVAWFWSDQLGLKLKIAGVLRPPYETVTRGDPSTGSFALFHHHDGRLVAVETANANADFMAAKRILAADLPVDPAHLGDPTIALRELAAA
jgi:3-phenylpropionate/trans-cinnamate dioxygenase ferredoxin reductase subunit